jgi:Tfp pilus assembly protein PilZ
VSDSRISEINKTSHEGISLERTRITNRRAEMFLEKRKYPRTNVSCKIKITTIFDEKQLVFETHPENIGVGGIKAILEEEIQVSTIVDLELYLFDKKKPLKLKGEIVWVQEIRPTGIKPRLFDTGIKFRQANGSGQEEIKKFVDALLSKRKRR